MKKFILAAILGFTTFGLVACDSEADITVKNSSIVKGNSEPVDSKQSDVNEDYLYLPVLNYELHVVDSTFKMHYLTVLHNGNLAVLELQDNKIKYSSKLRTFEGAFIKAKLTEKGNFQDVHLITEEEVDDK